MIRSILTLVVSLGALSASAPLLATAGGTTCACKCNTGGIYSWEGDGCNSLPSDVEFCDLDDQYVTCGPARVIAPWLIRNIRQMDIESSREFEAQGVR